MVASARDCMLTRFRVPPLPPPLPQFYQYSEWVMPGDYTQGNIIFKWKVLRMIADPPLASDTFTSCDGDSSYPPGVYPEANGETSTL